MMNSSELSTSCELAIAITQHLCGMWKYLARVVKQHLGAVFVPFNILILFLIIYDHDDRNKQYRKYLCILQVFWFSNLIVRIFSVQMFSLTFDTLSNIYAPIVIFNKGLVYSNSFLSRGVTVSQFMAGIEQRLLEKVFTFRQVKWLFSLKWYLPIFCAFTIDEGWGSNANSMFLKIFEVILSSDRWFNYFGWKRTALYVLIQVYVIAAVAGALFIANESLRSLEVPI